MTNCTKDVNEWEVNGGARRRLAMEVQQRLRIERSAPSEGVNPSEEGRKKGEEARHRAGSSSMGRSGDDEKKREDVNEALRRGVLSIGR